MVFSVSKIIRSGWFSLCAAVLTLTVLPLTSLVHAQALGSLYSYNLTGSSSVIANTAAENAGVNMNLTGNWSQTPFGVRFEGDLVSKRSVGYAKPASGSTINVPGTQAVGAAVLFRYQSPVSASCFSDSDNITQIGKFGAGLSQIKLQFSNCGVSSTKVYVQCRMAGSNSTTNDGPVTGTLPLVDGETYLATCVKAPDPASGSAIIELKTVRIDTVNGNQTVSNAFAITRTGTISSTDYLSVANKYPFGAQSANTDQFNGEVSRVAYCKGADIVAAKACLATEVPEPAGPAEPNPNEVHYAYGNTPDSVVFNWRGSEDTIYYGLTTDYDQQATAGLSPITPVDTTGPFREVALTGLQPNTSYHYKVGQNGTDATFKTIPTDDFSWVDIGDSKGSYCAPWMWDMHQLIAAQQPNFVTHGGDIAILNECGTPATHAYYTDQEVWSRSAAFQPAWGNHEYGAATANAPFGTPRDSLANYKGRSFITNAQTVPADITTKTSAPGCGQEIGSSINTCMGRDWGWFRAGNVLFISYPEQWGNALSDWQTKADALMANAQADNTVDFIVTYGHRPPYTSSSEGPDLNIRSTLNFLANKYSPRTDNPNGKYVINYGHHAHDEEVIGPVNGLTHIINAAGGQGFTNFTNVDPNSVFRMQHFAVVKTNYSASQHSLDVHILCGAEYTTIKYNCSYGQEVYSLGFQRADVPPVDPPAPDPSMLTTTLTDGATTVQLNDQLTYTTTVTNGPATAATATGLSLDLTLPNNVSVVQANGGTVTGNVVSWNIGDLAAAQQVSRQVTVAVQSGTDGEQLTATAVVSTTDTACQNSGSNCSAGDTTTISIPPTPPTLLELIGNQSVESNMTGWGGTYGTSPYVTVTRDTTTGHTGTASLKVTALTGASNLSSGFNDNPRWVTNTTAGKVYNQSVWVKAGFAGQKINLRLREWQGSTLVTDALVTYTTTSTNWEQITQQFTAAATGNQLSFAVYGNKMNAGQYFYADDMSLTTAP